MNNSSIDIIYYHIDGLFIAGKFEEVDLILKRTILSEKSCDILLALLTVTLPAKSKLKSRNEFYNNVELELKKRNEWEEGLLKGLS